MVAVLGGGSFGTVLADLLAENGAEARLWLRDAALAETINLDRRNDKYMPDHRLSERVRATVDLAEATDGVEMVFVAVPSESCAEVAGALAAHLPDQAFVVSTTKGLATDRFALMSEVLREALPDAPLGVLSGPNIAIEIARRQLSATVVASADARLRTAVQERLRTQFFRVYANEDVIGVELAGVLKNIYGIIGGIGDAWEVGRNTSAMIITRALAEMTRFAVDYGADPMTFLGLAGAGDLITTCTSPFSRNFQLGRRLGLGDSLQEALSNIDSTVEGVNTVRQLHERIKNRDMYMPLAAGMHRILFEGASIKEIVEELMAADQRDDVDFRARFR